MQKLRWSCSGTYQTGPTVSGAKHFPGGDAKLLTSQLILQEWAEVQTGMETPLKGVLGPRMVSETLQENQPQQKSSQFLQHNHALINSCHFLNISSWTRKDVRFSTCCTHKPGYFPSVQSIVIAIYQNYASATSKAF